MTPLSPSNETYRLELIQFLDPPPWENDSLLSVCQDINELPGQRENSYCELLESINETIDVALPQEISITLGQNLFHIYQEMPDEIKQREKIRSLFEELFFSKNDCDLLNSFYETLNKSSRGTLCHYQELLQIAEKHLQSEMTLSRLDCMSRCFNLIVYMLPNEIKTQAPIEDLISSIDSRITSLLESYCSSINRESEIFCLSRYRKLLKSLQASFDLQSTIKDTYRLSRNLLLILHKIPVAMRNVPTIAYHAHDLREKLVALYHTDFDLSKRYLAQAQTPSEKLRLKGKISVLKNHVPEGLDSAFTKELSNALR